MASNIHENIVFGYYTAKFHCQDTSIYTTPKLESQLTSLFTHTQKIQVPEHLGNQTSTINMNIEIHAYLDVERLLSWVKNNILKCSLCSQTPSSVSFSKIWANRMYFGSEVLSHTHERDIDGVAIFYQNVPSQGADLVFIRPNEDVRNVFGFSHTDFQASDVSYQNVRTGDLIIHHKLLPHAISKHLSSEPRTCFVFEFLYTFEKCNEVIHKTPVSGIPEDKNGIGDLVHEMINYAKQLNAENNALRTRLARIDMALGQR